MDNTIIWNRKAAKQQSSKAAKQQSSKAAKQQSSKAAKQQSSKAAKQLRKLDQQHQGPIRDAVESLGVKQLTNHDYGYRLRVGNYQVLFLIGMAGSGS